MSTVPTSWGHFTALDEQTLVTGGMFLRDGDGCTGTLPDFQNIYTELRAF